MLLDGVSMIDLLGVIGLIAGAAIATKYFWCGSLCFILGVILLLNGCKNADKYMEIAGPLAMVSIVVTLIIALFVNYS